MRHHLPSSSPASLVWLALLLWACTTDDAAIPEDAPKDATSDTPANADGDAPTTSPPATGDAGAMDAGDPGPPIYSICEPATRLGGFTLALEESSDDPERHYTSILGEVKTGVVPGDVLNVVMTADGCQLLQPARPFCDPDCASGQTCSLDGQCVPYPTGMNLGEATLTGVSEPLTVDAQPPAFRYSYNRLPHPGFSEGDRITLSTAGADAPALSIVAQAVGTLDVALEPVRVERGVPLTVTWTAREPSNAVQMEIELNLAEHGGTPARVRCEVADEGVFSLPVAMSNALLDFGYSGFPTLLVTRRGAGTAQLPQGCVDLRIESAVELPVDIPGLTSCSLNDDCVPPATCQVDLTCG